MRAICHAEGARSYLNPAGGRALYDAAEFLADGLALRFCAMGPLRYAQPAPAFVPNLSVIDALMHCPPAEVVRLFGGATLSA